MHQVLEKQCSSTLALRYSQAFLVGKRLGGTSTSLNKTAGCPSNSSKCSHSNLQLHEKNNNKNTSDASAEQLGGQDLQVKSQQQQQQRQQQHELTVESTSNNNKSSLEGQQSEAKQQLVGSCQQVDGAQNQKEKEKELQKLVGETDWKRKECWSKKKSNLKYCQRRLLQKIKKQQSGSAKSLSFYYSLLLSFSIYHFIIFSFFT